MHAMELAPLPGYQLNESPPDNNLVAIEMPPPPAYAEIDIRYPSCFSARCKRNLTFGTATIVLGGLGIFGLVHEGDVELDINTFLPIFGAVGSLAISSVSVLYICARERYKREFCLRDCFDKNS